MQGHLLAGNEDAAMVAESQMALAMTLGKMAGISGVGATSALPSLHAQHGFPIDLDAGPYRIPGDRSVDKGCHSAPSPVLWFAISEAVRLTRTSGVRSRSSRGAFRSRVTRRKELPARLEHLVATREWTD
jgi:hypothetical protein